MATIRRGGTGNGILAWGVPELLKPVSFAPQPPIPPMPPPQPKATIVSFQTPILLSGESRAVAKVTNGTPTQFRWQYQAAGGSWVTVATNPASDLDHHYAFSDVGHYPIRLQTLLNGAVTDTSSSTSRVIVVTALPVPIPPNPEPQPPTPGPGEILVHLTDMRSELPIADAEAWWQIAPTLKTLTDINGYVVVAANGSGVCVRKDGYHSPGLPTQIETCKPTEPRLELVLERIPPPPPPVPIIHAAGRIFRDEAQQPWRYKGFSSFKLLRRWADGANIQPVLDAYHGYNVARVWAYTDWAGTGWECPPAAVTREFFQHMAEHGLLVEFTLLTNDSLAKSDWARDYVAQLSEGPRPPAFIEGRNEPETHSQTVSTARLKPALDGSGFVYASGNYEVSAHAYGPFLVAHTSRDSEWPRRCHDLMEYFNGAGPHKPSDPSHKVPCVADEPAKLEDVAGPKPPLTKADDWRAYFGGCALLGAGATFHSESGKWGLPPTAEEAGLAKAALEGLDAFPANAPLGAYTRPSDNSLRTYIVGNSMVRIRPTTPNPSFSGWTRVGASDILWRRS